MKLFQWVTQDPERTLALTERGERLCYGDIAEASKRFDGELGHDLLFTLCRNSPGALLGYLGAMNSRAVPLLLDAAMDASLLRELAERYRPGFCLLPAERAEELRGMFPAGEKCFTLWDMELWRTGWTGPKLHPDLKLLLTTSGSTGSPKLVRISKTNLDSNAASIASYLELDEEERPITSLPLFYSYAQYGAISDAANLSFLLGISIKMPLPRRERHLCKLLGSRSPILTIVEWKSAGNRDTIIYLTFISE